MTETKETKQEKPTGGPAFPYVANFGPDDRGVVEGMTLRDYFIAHAPAEPQFWFIPVMPSERPVAVYERDVDRDMNDEFFASNKREIREWDAERQKQVLIQWPGAWADAQIAEREKKS